MNSVKLHLNGNVLTAESSCGVAKRFDFPAAAISVDGVRVEASTPVGTPLKLDNGGWQALFADRNFNFKVTVYPAEQGSWFFKQVEITTDLSRPPTPDYVEVDFQKQAVSNLESRGYMCSCTDIQSIVNEEEGHGIAPGCGYPLVADDMFTGIEHPAAYNTIVSEKDGVYQWYLRHFPVWQNSVITSCRAVIALGDDPRTLLFDYIDTFRLPVRKTPAVAFNTFWSDPYLGNYEYNVTQESYISLLNAFRKLDLRPELYSLDAGWQDRQSILRAKESYGGEQELISIAQKFRAAGSDLSLWVSPNGPVGISTDYLRSQGFEVGEGKSCHYCYGTYGVLLDKKLEDALTERVRELVSQEYSVRHFKVDWDNECASNDAFSEKYPTRNHVREATLDIMARINQAARDICPEILTRNGRWPSPWYLDRSSHVSLPNCGDSEFASLPALSQRDAGTNHRDLIYWCVFVRDKTIFPLDVFDNHEFAHSIRNPFQETPGVWSNTCVWAVMRGTSYHQLALMPESLEDWQADILRHTLAMLRENTQRIVTPRSRMIGDNPGKGGIYGFVHPAPDGSCTLALRNASPLPQEYILPDEAPFYEQSYPDCRRFKAGEKVLFAPHEVKVLNGTISDKPLFASYPCQLTKGPDGSCRCFLPASARPDVLPIHQIPELKQCYCNTDFKEELTEFTFGVMVPWRMREFKAVFKIAKADCTAADIEVRTSRMKDCRTSAYSIPFAEIPYGIPGAGQRKNPDTYPGKNCRYFTADLPQGGEVFFSITLKRKDISPGDIELWVSGYEAPARSPEPGSSSTVPPLLPLPFPPGFPRSLRLL